MRSWRKVSTAPRDGTLIVGLFERRNKRAIALRASFSAEDYRRLLADPAPKAAPQWVKDSEEESLERYKSDPSYGFAPEGDENETAGSMIAWRPISAADEKKDR